MLKKVLAVFPVFIFFAFLGLFVFASPSSSVVFEVQPQPLSNEQKQDRTWEWIKSELRNRYTYLDFHPDWKPFFAAAKGRDYDRKGSKLEETVKNPLLVIFDEAKRKDKTGILEYFYPIPTSYLRTQRLRWNSLVDNSVGEDQDALLNPQYAYLAKTPISIEKGEKVYKVSLEPLFIAAKRFGALKTAEEFSKVKIPGFRKMIWDFRFLFSVWESDINAAFAAADAENKPKLNNLWTGIKDELKKPEYVYLVKTPILINDENYDLEPLFEVAQSGFAGNGYALTLAAKIKLQDLVNAGIDHQVFKNSLATANIQNNQKLDNFWEELKKTKYVNLARLPVKININNKSYDLAKIFSTITQFNGKGSQLPLEPITELQNLINAGINPRQLGDVLKQMLTSLDNLWTQLKKILNQPEFSKWKNTSIKIKNKNYDLSLLFAAAKEKADVKGSALPLDTKLKLQELLNDQVTSKMVENQLLALNQAEAENNKQAEPAKNKQVKKKQQSQGLTIGLATGGGVLVAAGLGSFLYWFFKIRK